MTSLPTLIQDLTAAVELLQKMRGSTDADELRARWNARAEQCNKEKTK